MTDEEKLQARTNIGLPFPVDVDGDIIVSMKLADVAGIVSNENVLGHVGGVLSIGDGATTGGVMIPPPLLLAADPVVTEFVTVTGTLTSDGSTPIATPVNVPKVSEEYYYDGGTTIIERNNPDDWYITLGYAIWTSSVGDDLDTVTWTAQGTNTGIPVVTITRASLGVPGQLAIVADGGVWICDALGVWQELL